MKKKRHTEAQIAFLLRQAESGTPVSEIVRKMEISEATFYRWKQKFDGLGVGEVRRLKPLQKQYWGQHLWARGYFVASSGNVTDEAIMAYIQGQDGTEPGDGGDNFRVPSP